MDLFSNITELQDFVNVDSTLKLKSLEPFENEVIELYLLDWLGITQYNRLKEDLTGPDNAVLLPYVRRVVANFCTMLYMDVGVVNIGNSGVNRSETDNSKTAYKYQIAATKQRLQESGWNAVESMIAFLETNKASYPDWVEESRANCRKLMINSYREFRQYYHVVNGRWVFEGLRTVMEDVELFNVVSVIGKPFYDELKSEILADTLTAENKEALKYLNKAVAYLTIEKAIAQKVGELQNNQFVFTAQSGDDGIHQSNTALDMSKRKNAATIGTNYLAYAKSFLIENKDDYPIFKTWYDAKIAAVQETAVEWENPKVVFI